MKIKHFFLLDIKVAFPLMFKYTINFIFPRNQLKLTVYIFILSIFSFIVSNQLIINSEIKDNLSFYHTTTARKLNRFIAKNDIVNIYPPDLFPIDLIRQSIEYFYQLIEKEYTRSEIDIFPPEQYKEVLKKNNFSQVIDNKNNDLEIVLNYLYLIKRKENYLQIILNWLQVFNILYAFMLGLVSVGKLKEQEEFIFNIN